MESDRANSDFTRNKEIAKEVRSSTKGRFPRDYQTNGGAWIQDRDWKAKANPTSMQNERALDEKDLRMLERRRKQKLL